MPDPVDPCLDTCCEAAPDGRLFCRATGVALDGQGVLIFGPSGSGKSRLALDLLALGACLICDDGLFLTGDGHILRPENAPMLVEARGIGLLHAVPVDGAPLALVVDLARTEPDRLPPMRRAAVPGGTAPLILGRDNRFLAPAIRQYVKHGREV